MITNKIKIFLILAITIPLFAVMIFSTPYTKTVAAEDDAAAVYKAKCAMCHTAKATKYFDPELEDAVLVGFTLNGKKGEKPPYMPAFEGKISAEMAAALVSYMKQLRAPEDSNANSNADATETDDAEITDEALAAAATTYKAKCAMCHGPKAAKSYDPEMCLDRQVEAILKGKKGEKPPFMPGFDSKNIDAYQAKALAVYMRKLRTAEE